MSTEIYVYYLLHYIVGLDRIAIFITKIHFSCTPSIVPIAVYSLYISLRYSVCSYGVYHHKIQWPSKRQQMQKYQHVGRYEIEVGRATPYHDICVYIYVFTFRMCYQKNCQKCLCIMLNYQCFTSIQMSRLLN